MVNGLICYSALDAADRIGQMSTSPGGWIMNVINGLGLPGDSDFSICEPTGFMGRRSPYGWRIRRFARSHPHPDFRRRCGGHADCSAYGLGGRMHPLVLMAKGRRCPLREAASISGGCVVSDTLPELAGGACDVLV